MPNLLALTNRIGKANRQSDAANVLAVGVATYEALPRRMAEVVADLKRDGLDRRTLSETAMRSHGWVDSVLKGRATGKAAGPGAIALARFCEEYGYNVRWLITGLGPKLINREDDVRAARERNEAPPMLTVPSHPPSPSAPPPAARRGTADAVAQRLLEERPARRRTRPAKDERE